MITYFIYFLVFLILSFVSYLAEKVKKIDEKVKNENKKNIIKLNHTKNKKY